MNGKEVIYIYNETLCSECDRNPRIAGRATQVHELIRAYGLLDKMTVHPSRPAYDEEINTFHSSSYIDFLKEINSSSDLEVHEDEAEQFGLNYDCPLVERLYDFVKAIAGSSISGAEAIVGGKAKVAINWFGGWHHAQSVMLKIWKTFNPEVIVVQCGADGLSGDPTNAFNLTLQGFAKCVKTILSWNLPTMFLGGGGYNHPNVARCWTYLTSLIVEQEIKSSIPDHEYFMDYGPDFELDILPGCRKDNNSKESLDSIIQCVSGLGAMTVK
ncbi:Histone deacetylase [Gryllus bimaculatus]|nr:Histone deacetylase [Gryllus bimaculatus]